MLTVGPFEMETEAASVCAPTSHTVGLSHCRSLLGDGGGCRVGVREGGGDRGVSGRGPRCPTVCGGTGQLQLTGGPIHAIR